MVHQIAYVSSARLGDPTPDLTAIAAASRRNNERDDVTGLMLYHDGLFFQFLEGPRAAVAACYERIAADRRHAAPALIYEGESDARAFPAWRMSVARPDDLGPEAAAAAIALADLLQDGAAGIGNDPTAATLVESVLSGFRGVSRRTAGPVPEDAGLAGRLGGSGAGVGSAYGAG